MLGATPDDKICKLIIRDNIAKFESVETVDLSLETLYREDAKYGFLRSLSGKKYLTYQVLNGDDELPNEIADYIANVAFMGWVNEVNMHIRRAKPNEEADIKIKFDDTTHDKTLTTNTLAYMYYPINTKSQYRGICVVNKAYRYTINGKGINMHIIDPVHYPDPNTKTTAKTWDLDQILRHEFGHGLFGLIHDGKSGNTMSASYEHTAEELTERDILRAAKKVGKKTWKRPDLFARWRKWYYTKKSENFHK